MDNYSSKQHTERQGERERIAFAAVYKKMDGYEIHKHSRTTNQITAANSSEVYDEE